MYYNLTEKVLSGCFIYTHLYICIKSTKELLLLIKLLLIQYVHLFSNHFTD